MLCLPNRDRWEMLVTVPLPQWIHVQQMFPTPEELDVVAAVHRELRRPEIQAYLRPGMSIALGVGSRGLHALPRLIAAIVAAVKASGCQPFIVPAMGSHGGATARGQQQILEGYGVTEASLGVPICSSMDVVEIGRCADGLPIYFDKHALSADLIVPINRVKAHTSFYGPPESGLTKMLAIGFGKHVGATILHRQGYEAFPARLREAREIIKAHTPFRFGLATVENAYNRTALIEAIPANRLVERENELLALAKQWMPHLLFTNLDVLVVYQIGKNISGSGMDPNVMSRSANGLRGKLDVNKIVVLRLSPGTYGNATGLGMADVTTEHVIREINLDTTWINVFTSTCLPNARIPVFMPNDRMAMQLAIKTCHQTDVKRIRMAWIHDTLNLQTIYVSEALWSEVSGSPGFVDVGTLEPVPFDVEGNLIWKEEYHAFYKDELKNNKMPSN